MNALFISNTLINIAIVIGVVVSIYYTKNPLLIVGLYFLQPLPPVEQAYDEYADEDDGQGQQSTEAEGGYAGTAAGFTATIK